MKGSIDEAPTVSPSTRHNTDRRPRSPVFYGLKGFWWLFIQTTFGSRPLFWFSFVNGDKGTTPTISPTTWPIMHYMGLLCAFSSLRAPQRPLSSGFWTWPSNARSCYNYHSSPHFFFIGTHISVWCHFFTRLFRLHLSNFIYDNVSKLKLQNLKASLVVAGEMAQRLSPCCSFREPEVSS